MGQSAYSPSGELRHERALESLNDWGHSEEGFQPHRRQEEKPRSDVILKTARGTKSGTSGPGDCWDSADVIPSTRRSGPEIPPTLQSPHVSQDFLSLDHLLSRVPFTLRRFVAECNKKDGGWLCRSESYTEPPAGWVWSVRHSRFFYGDGPIHCPASTRERTGIIAACWLRSIACRRLRNAFSRNETAIRLPLSSPPTAERLG